MELSPEKIAKMNEGRKKAAAELLATEETYVKNLAILMKEFYTPMVAYASSSTPESKRPISLEDVRFIFGSLNIILPINQTLLEDLRKNLKDINHQPLMIGSPFQDMAPCLKSYKQYCIDFDQSRKILSNLKENIEFNEFLDKLHDTKKVGNLTLKDFLIMPVQRIPRYRMLLSEIVKNTPEDHPDYAASTSALSSISSTAQAIEDATEKVFNMNKIISIQNKIKPPKKSSERITLLEPDRLYITEEKLMVKDISPTCNNTDYHKRTVVMFNDLLLITKVVHQRDKRKEQLRLMQALYLVNLLQVSQTAEGCSLVMENSDKYLIQIPDDKKEYWVNTLDTNKKIAIDKRELFSQRMNESSTSGLNRSGSTVPKLGMGALSLKDGVTSDDRISNSPRQAKIKKAISGVKNRKGTGSSSTGESADNVVVVTNPLLKYSQSQRSSMTSSCSGSDLNRHRTRTSTMISGTSGSNSVRSAASSASDLSDVKKSPSMGSFSFKEQSVSTPSPHTSHHSSSSSSAGASSSSSLGNAALLSPRTSFSTSPRREEVVDIIPSNGDDLSTDKKRGYLAKSTSANSINKIAQQGAPTRKKEVPLAL